MGGNQQIRNADRVHDALRTRSFVVLLSVAVVKMRGGDRVIKFPYRPDAAEAIAGISVWKKLGLFGVACQQSGYKMALIEKVGWPLERIGTRAKIKRRAHGGNST